MENEVLSIVDKRTKATYDLPLARGAVRAMDLRQIKTGPEDFGVMSYDPAFLNTASCQSAITFIDGDKGILRYRGYPIEQLAEKCGFLEVAYLVLFGELPTEPELKEWTDEITHHTMLHENTKKFLEGFRHDAHPMGISSALWQRSPRFIRTPGISSIRSTQAAILSPHRQGSNHRRLLLPPQPRLSLRLSGQRSELHREFHEHAVEDGRAEVPGEFGFGSGARHFVYPARRPRAELQYQRHAGRGQLPGGPVRCHCRRCRRAFRSAAWGRQRRGVEDAGRDRIQKPRPGLH